MSEDTNPAGGAGEESGSADSKTQELKTDDTPKMVSWENHRRALDDMHKYKSKAKDLEDKSQKAEEEKLAKDGEHKSLAEHYKKRADEAEAKLGKVTEGFVNTQKRNAVVEAALAVGLLPEAKKNLEMYHFEGVEIETVESASGNTLRVQGAKEFVERLKAESPFLFAKPGAPKINSGGSGEAPQEPKTLTADDVWASEKKVRNGQRTQAEHLALHERYIKQK